MHNDHRRAHDHCRTSHDDIIMPSVPGVPAMTVVNKTAGGGEEGEDAADQKDFLHA